MNYEQLPDAGGSGNLQAGVGPVAEHEHDARARPHTSSNELVDRGASDNTPQQAPNLSAGTDEDEGPSVTIHQTTNTVYLNEEDLPDGGDSTFGDEDVESETTSLAASVLNYEYENGRRYHAYRAGKYPMPNDPAEQDRMDMQHHLYLLILQGRLCGAPLPETVEKVLDIGCGTGKWAMDFADQHPESSIIATDLSVIQPEWVPPNLQFEIDDAEESWGYTRQFDYIHVRSMGGSISDWPKLLRQAYQHLKPGGWVELVDFETWATTDDNSLPIDSPYQEFQVKLSEAARMFGKEMNISPQYHGFVQNAGFMNVNEEKFKAPLSPWPTSRREKILGRYMQAQMMESIEPYSLALFTRVLKWEPERVQMLLAGVRKDLMNLDYHMYSVVHCVYGQKPWS